MELQRYLQRNEDIGAYFGRNSPFHTWDFDYYIDENRGGIADTIGLTSNQSTNANSFISGILHGIDRLIVRLPYPGMWLERASAAVICPRDNGDEEYIGKLAELIQSQDVTHVYASSLNADGELPNVLTFSYYPPPGQLYIPDSTMPVVLKRR